VIKLNPADKSDDPHIYVFVTNLSVTDICCIYIIIVPFQKIMGVYHVRHDEREQKKLYTLSVVGSARIQWVCTIELLSASARRGLVVAGPAPPLNSLQLITLHSNNQSYRHQDHQVPPLAVDEPQQMPHYTRQWSRSS
jgi:hypothetical protein